MSRHHTSFLLSIFIFFLGLTATAWADLIQGKVVSAKSSQVILQIYDNSGKPFPNTLPLKTDSRTRVTGFPSISSLRAQDWVESQITRQSSGQWHADSVKLLQTTGQNFTHAPQPSPSLMDALKSPASQKILKRGLGGAAVGGIAAEASGGKAGKGALIGAGVNLLGGWLSDALSQPRQPQVATQTSSESDARPYRDRQY